MVYLAPVALEGWPWRVQQLHQCQCQPEGLMRHQIIRSVLWLLIWVVIMGNKQTLKWQQLQLCLHSEHFLARLTCL
jgi:hypothetical protein